MLLFLAIKFIYADTIFSSSFYLEVIFDRLCVNYEWNILTIKAIFILPIGDDIRLFPPQVSSLWKAKFAENPNPVSPPAKSSALYVTRTPELLTMLSGSKCCNRQQENKWSLALNNPLGWNNDAHFLLFSLGLHDYPVRQAKLISFSCSHKQCSVKVE